MVTLFFFGLWKSHIMGFMGHIPNTIDRNCGCLGLSKLGVPWFRWIIIILCNKSSISWAWGIHVLTHRYRPPPETVAWRSLLSPVSLPASQPEHQAQHVSCRWSGYNVKCGQTETKRVGSKKRVRSSHLLRAHNFTIKCIIRYLYANGSTVNHLSQISFATWQNVVLYISFLDKPKYNVCWLYHHLCMIGPSINSSVQSNKHTFISCVAKIILNPFQCLFS